MSIEERLRLLLLFEKHISELDQIEMANKLNAQAGNKVVISIFKNVEALRRIYDDFRNEQLKGLD